MFFRDLYSQGENTAGEKKFLVFQLLQKKLQEISEYLSFSNQSFFTKCFKEETGMTPKEFRESHFG